jgi:uncharacterized membrane protein
MKGTRMKNLASAIIRFFFTGVATLLPFIVTVFVVSWAVRIADAYVGPSSSFWMFLEKIFGPQYRWGYLVGYLVAVLLIILLGFLVTRATVAKFHKALDSMVSKIPLIGKIYAGVGQIVEIFGRKDQGGLERFGGAGQISVGNVKLLGLLSSGHRYKMPDGRDHLLVFIPNSPIPLTGFNMLVPVEDFQRLDIPVEDLAKLLMSLGVLGPQILPGSIAHGSPVLRAEEK